MVGVSQDWMQQAWGGQEHWRQWGRRCNPSAHARCNSFGQMTMMIADGLGCIGFRGALASGAGNVNLQNLDDLSEDQNGTQRNCKCKDW